MITVSVISHNHGYLIKKIIKQLVNFHQITKIIVTLNVPEKFRYPKSKKIKLIINKKRVGFGENHNKAFNFCKTRFFLVLNPDIKFINNPFYKLIKKITTTNSGLIAPLVINKKGNTEDSFRKFPSFFSIFKKFFFKYTDIYHMKKKDTAEIYPDWVAGMFMLFESKVFSKIGGFDIKYFLYYEDVDICARLRIAGEKVCVNLSTRIIHDARRDSRKKIFYLFLHIKSFIRFLLTHKFMSFKK